MTTEMIRIEGRNADRFPIVINPKTIDLLVLPPQVLLTRGIDTGLTDSYVVGEWDTDTLHKPLTLKAFHTASRNTKINYNCAHKLRADLENIVKHGTFTMLQSTSAGDNGDDQIALVNLENVHQLRWSSQKLRIYFDFVWGGRQFLQAIDRDDLVSDVNRVESGWHDNFSFMAPPVEPVKARRRQHRPRELKNTAAIPQTISV